MNLIQAEDIKDGWPEYTEELYKKDLHDRDHTTVWSLILARHAGMWSQVGLRKHPFEQS